MIVLAADVGGWSDGSHAGTGLTVLDSNGMTILHDSIEKLDPYHMVQRYEELREKYKPDVLLAEGFKPRYGTPFSLEPVYLLGALQGFYNGAIKIIYPSEHIGTVSKDRLTKLMKEHNLEVRQGHSRMSLSLCVYYLAFKMQDAEAIHYLLGEQND